MPDFNCDCENCGKREAITRCPCSNDDCRLWVCKRCAKAVRSGQPHRVPVVPVSDHKPEPPPGPMAMMPGPLHQAMTAQGWSLRKIGAVMDFAAAWDGGVEMSDNDVPFEVDDAIVLLLGAPARSPSLRGRIDGITRLEKLVFLLENETDLADLMTEEADFVGHNFGPFSAKVYQAVETLEAAELITDSATLSPTDEDSWEADWLIGEGEATTYTTRDFELTERGKQYYNALLAELPDGTELKLQQFKDKFAALPLRQLIRYVYTRYEGPLTDNSLIRKEILGR